MYFPVNGKQQRILRRCCFYDSLFGAIKFSKAFSIFVCRMTKWMAGATMRSMSSPHDFKQPVSKSDPYYLPPTNNPSNDNDLGGVHQNSSLLAQIAYQLWAKGMSLEECRSLCLTSSEMLTPLSVYPDVYGMLLMSVDINQLDPSYKQMITDAFHAAGLLN